MPVNEVLILFVLPTSSLSELKMLTGPSLLEEAPVPFLQEYSTKAKPVGETGRINVLSSNVNKYHHLLQHAARVSSLNCAWTNPLIVAR